MTILDELFNAAAQDYTGLPNVSVTASFTTNQTGGLQSNTNQNAAPPPVVLTYSPSQTFGGGTKHPVEIVPASFSSKDDSIIIYAPVPVDITPRYSVHYLGTKFYVTVDSATNVIYGAAGSVFVTIALCIYEVPRDR
ncbi:MAG: hypothetical protein JO033_22980 [Acidobacteriaceae bacterium]|nr:hypothetical protein [Acidobacteriaceae bacterium]MBV9501620.1 hypothetical protein [Acidobacteriaceae bacterium]